MTYFDILIRNGRIWDGERFIQGDVAIQKGKIAAIGEVQDFSPTYTYDATGAIVAPGLIDIHTHLRGLSDPVYEVNGEISCFPCGVTAVGDAGTWFESDEPKRSLLKMRLFPNVNVIDGKVDFSMADRVIAHYGPLAVGVKATFDQGMFPDITLDYFREICDYAHKRGRKVMVHCVNPPVTMEQMLDCMKPGDICTHAFHGTGHSLTEDCFIAMRRARERGILFDTGLAQGYHTNFEVLREAIGAGLFPDTISTDLTSYSMHTNNELFGISAAISLLECLGMSEEEILASVTSRAARALGLEAECGYLHVGRRADVAVLRICEICDKQTDRQKNVICLNKGYRCVLTIADGTIVYRR